MRHADDHIHIVATTVRADGRRPRTNRDGQRAQDECRLIEKDFGLRRLRSGDRTAPKTPTSAERSKAERQGRSSTSRAWLREQAYEAVATVRTEEEFFAVLNSLGIQVRKRIGPDSGQAIGYSLAAPGDTNAQGEPVWFGGSKLAPDLSLHRVRERLHARQPAESRSGNARPVNPWSAADTELRKATALLNDDDAKAQARFAAFSELLHTTAATAPATVRAELRAAAAAFNRANRSAIRADHQSAAALRHAAKEVLHAVGSDDDGAALAALLSTAVLLAVAAVHWYEARGHQQQAAAARQTAEHLRDGYERTARPLLAELTRHAPSAQAAHAFETEVRHALPEHADRLLADPAWPALAATLARAQGVGRSVRQVLAQAADQRELDTADSPAQVLIWRMSTMPDQRVAAAISRSRSRYGQVPGSEAPFPTPSAAPLIKDAARKPRR